jgi:hypothetical protein
MRPAASILAILLCAKVTIEEAVLAAAPARLYARHQQGYGAHLSLSAESRTARESMQSSELQNGIQGHGAHPYRQILAPPLHSHIVNSEVCELAFRAR